MTLNPPQDSPARPLPRLLRASSSCVLLLGFLIFGCGEKAPPRYQNLIVVMIDTLRSDHLGSYGYHRDTAPFLDSLAEEGIRLQGYSASSWTRPSIATLMTGLHPQRHQAIGRTDSLPETLPYLPEILREEGFATVGYAGNMNASRKWGFHRGFEVWGQCPPTGKVKARRINREVLPQIEGMEAPFFLYLHYVDPHDPYRPDTPWGVHREDEPFVQPKHLQKRGKPWSEGEIQRLVDQYDGEIREMDREIERLFRNLEERGLLEKTLVVITSDHGEEFHEHGGLTHGATLFEEVLRVPMILWSREGLPSYRSEEAFHQVDFLPTVLEALGRPGVTPERLDGRGHWRAITRREPLENGDLLFHLDLSGRGALALQQPPRKVIHRAGRPHDLWFFLDSDPEEKVVLPHEGSVAGPEFLLLRRQLLRQHNRLGTLAAQRQQREMDDESRRALAALGYLELATPEEELAHRTVPRLLDRERGFAALETRGGGHGGE